MKPDLRMKEQIAPEGVCYDPRLRLPEPLDQVLLYRIDLFAKAQLLEGPYGLPAPQRKSASQ